MLDLIMCLFRGREGTICLILKVVGFPEGSSEEPTSRRCSWGCLWTVGLNGRPYMAEFI